MNSDDNTCRECGCWWPNRENLRFHESYCHTHLTTAKRADAMARFVQAIRSGEVSAEDVIVELREHSVTSEEYRVLVKVLQDATN